MRLQRELVRSDGVFQGSPRALLGGCICVAYNLLRLNDVPERMPLRTGGSGG